MKLAHTILFIVLVTGQSSPQDNLSVLVDWMIGSFSSEAQALEDTNYFNIELEMIQIWKDRADGPWIYVEQAVAEYKNKPYRQRVYHLIERVDGKIESVVYTIPDPLRFAGDYNSDTPLQGLEPDSLNIRKGCKVVLLRINKNHFEGSTLEKNCSSNLRGAIYATSEVFIKEDRIVSWDRGFDENDTQVWGAEKEGYIFIKNKE